VVCSNIRKCKELSKAPRLLLRELLVIGVVLCAGEAHAEDAGEAVQSFEKAVSSNSFETICRTLERSAADNNLPIEFFTRVIWQESRFTVRALSSAGAQGIAQFMPRTAASRGPNRDILSPSA
jgi:soluble lytic murein transglycosylase-like protein